MVSVNETMIQSNWTVLGNEMPKTSFSVPCYAALCGSWNFARIFKRICFALETCMKNVANSFLGDAVEGRLNHLRCFVALVAAKFGHFNISSFIQFNFGSKVK